jgi:putative NADH-flavin reductase
VQSPNLHVVKGDIFNSESIASAAASKDVLISAYGPQHGQEQRLLEATRALIDGVKRSGVRRLISVGGAGSLEVAPGVQLVDTPEFPEAWKGIALAHRDALDIYRQSDIDWTNISPAAFIAPGERTGTYRTGTDHLVVDEKGESRISAEDYAVAVLDEAENPKFIRRRFTVAY